jgi:hypothetical protein
MRLLIPVLAVSLTMPAIAQTGVPSMSAQHSGAMDNMKIEDDNDPFVPNAFTGSFTLEIQNYADGKPTTEAPHVMHFWSSPDKVLMEFQAIPGQGAQMKMLTDLKEKWTYMMMTDGQGNKRAMKSHKKKIVYTGDPDAHITVTKETKVIDGHACTKVIGTSKEGTWTAWVAKDIDVNLSDIMGAGPGRSKESRDWKDVKGFPLEMTMTDKDGHTNMVMHIRDFKVGSVDPSVFSMDGYQVMEIPGMGQ